MESVPSEYSLSLDYLLKAYSEFVGGLKSYLAMPLTASRKL
jgi:transposase-like protein